MAPLARSTWRFCWVHGVHVSSRADGRQWRGEVHGRAALVGALESRAGIVVAENLRRFLAEAGLAFGAPLAQADGMSKTAALAKLKRGTEVHDSAMVAEDTMSAHGEAKRI